jgi:hypothetical protein
MVDITEISAIVAAAGVLVSPSIENTPLGNSDFSTYRE